MKMSIDKEENNLRRKTRREAVREVKNIGEEKKK